MTLYRPQWWINNFIFRFKSLSMYLAVSMLFFDCIYMLEGNLNQNAPARSKMLLTSDLGKTFPEGSKGRRPKKGYHFKTTLIATVKGPQTTQEEHNSQTSDLCK